MSCIGRRASGSARFTSGITAIASASLTTPRTPGTRSAALPPRSGLRPDATLTSPEPVRTAAAQWVGPCTSKPFRRAMPPRRSFSSGTGAVISASPPSAQRRSSPQARGRQPGCARRRRGSAARTRTRPSCLREEAVRHAVGERPPPPVRVREALHGERAHHRARVLALDERAGSYSISGVSIGERLPTTCSANSSSRPSSSKPPSAARTASSPSSGGTRQSTPSSRPGGDHVDLRGRRGHGRRAASRRASAPRSTASRGSVASSARMAPSGSRRVQPESAEERLGLGGARERGPAPQRAPPAPARASRARCRRCVARRRGRPARAPPG